MVALKIGHGIQSALSHFALYGLAILCDEQWPGEVRIHWTDEYDSQAELLIPNASEEQIANTLLKYAQALARPDAWPQVRNGYGSGKKTVQFAPFSPRFRAIDPESDPADWHEHQHLRHATIDSYTQALDMVSLQWIQALGEAAYWRCDAKNKRPDEGASRWEMKTRNRGEEFVQHRLSPMVQVLSTWSTHQVLSGITGQTIHDPLGKNSVDSRTSTGLTSPGPTDVALAFAALIGISLFPMMRNTAGISVTPGAWPPQALHPSGMILPVPLQKITVARLRTIIASESMAVVANHYGAQAAREEQSATDGVLLQAARSWLISRGVAACSVFPILKTGSVNAPERQVQRGQVKLL